MQVTIEEEELRQLLNERDHLRQQVADLQAAGTALVKVRREQDITYRVAEFHSKYGFPNELRVVEPSRGAVDFRLKLMIEEFFETLAALGPNVGILESLKKDLLEVVLRRTGGIDMIELADGLCDVDYINEGTRQFFGIPRAAVLAEVQKSNMSKLVNPNGGKPIKPPGWVPPDEGIERVLREHGWNG